MKFIKSAVSIAALCLLSALTPLSVNAYEAVNAKIPVSCLDAANGRRHTYTIKMEPENEYCPAPVSDTLEITEAESSFFELDITEPGTFNYKIYEFPGQSTDIQYDTNVYNITVYTVIDSNDELNYSIIAHTGENDSKSGEIVFENQIRHSGKDQNETETSSDTAAFTTESALPETDTASSAGDTPETDVTSASSNAGLTDASASADTGTATGTSDAADNNVENGTKASEAGGGDKTIGGFLTDVLTGDNFPARALRLTLLAAFAAAVIALVLKRITGKEGDENED